MRILLVHHASLDHASLDGDEAGSQAMALARLLQAAGHEPRIFAVSDQTVAATSVPAAWVIADPQDAAADLPFLAPVFMPIARSGQDFCDLTNAELDTYRNVLRQRLDKEVHQFNPHVIHCQHVWVLGHLALETGAPYVLTAHASELDALVRDPRYSRFAHQAAENAGRILVATKELAKRVGRVFPESADRVLVLRTNDGAEIVAVYQAVLRERGVGLAE